MNPEHPRTPEPPEKTLLPFHLHGPRKENVVLEVHVLVQIALELVELAERRLVRGTRVVGRSEAARELVDPRHGVPGALVLHLHHADRVLHRAERGRRGRTARGRLLRQHLDVGEEDLLLLHHVLRHFLRDALEDARDLDHLGVALAVLLGDLGGVRQEGRDRTPDVGVVGRDDVVHERGGVHGRVVPAVFPRRGVEARQLGEQRLGRHAGLAARRAQGASAPAAVVDAVLLEDGRGPVIPGHDVANGRFGGDGLHRLSPRAPWGQRLQGRGRADRRL